MQEKAVKRTAEKNQWADRNNINDVTTAWQQDRKLLGLKIKKERNIERE